MIRKKSINGGNSISMSSYQSRGYFMKDTLFLYSCFFMKESEQVVIFWDTGGPNEWGPSDSATLYRTILEDPQSDWVIVTNR